MRDRSRVRFFPFEGAAVNLVQAPRTPRYVLILRQCVGSAKRGPKALSIASGVAMTP